MEDTINIEPFDYRALDDKYPNISSNVPEGLPFIPFSEFGLYASEAFYAVAGEQIELVVTSISPIGINTYDYHSQPDLDGKLSVGITHRHNVGEYQVIDSSCFNTPDNLSRY